MASIIRIKRSSVTNKPASLNWGEMGYVTGIGSYGGVNQYKDRIFIGDDGTNVHPVGGHYYTSMMEHTPGNIPSAAHNSRNTDKGVVAIMAPAVNTGLGGAESLKVDQWNVDNLRLDGNVISSTDTDGDIKLDPNGSGEVHIPDDTFLSFGDDKDAKIEYDENGTDRLVFSGAHVVFQDQLNVETRTELGKVRIEDNIISTVSGAGNLLYLDPYPDGLSNEGTVIVKGSLQVDGTTTSVNSTVSTLNDPILHLGDLTSEKTVMGDAAVGVSTIKLDSVVGINTSDVITGSPYLGLSGVGTVTSYDTINNIVTIDTTVRSPGITTTTQLTVTHAYDTQTDRGISFGYNTSIGVGNNKLGFFGMDDSSIADSTADVDNHGTHADNSRRWTYVPDANLANSLITGTKGFLDVKGIYYQSGDFATGGVVFFDDTGLQRSTNAPAAPVISSKQILTAITKNTLTVGSSVTLAEGDIVKQDTTGAYGVVESAVSGTTIPLIGVEGTFDTSANLRKEGVNGSIDNLSLIPATVSVIYNNKPHWTSTLDGGTF